MPDSTTIRIWDLPTRLFHWLLVICVIGSFITVNVGGFWMDYHFLFGYGILALLLFRIGWGVAGPRHARFTSFLRGPRTLLAYLRGKHADGGGHSPLGALSVLAMLIALGVQAVTGLFANDGIMNEGPLAVRVSGAVSDAMTGIHQLNETVLLVLIGLHLAAIVWYALRGRRLTRAMVTGDKAALDLPPGTAPARDDALVRTAGFFLCAAAAALVWWVIA